MNYSGGPISQEDIERELLRLTKELEDQTELYKNLLTSAAKKEATHKTEWSKVFLSAEGSVQQRSSWADYTCHETGYEAKVASALAASCKESLYSIRANLNALQTLSANLRAQT